jgi:hypothetical protein
MKVCNSTCALAVVLLMGSISTFLFKKKDIFSNFKDSLTNEQKELYEKLSEERRAIYKRGMLYGVILSVLLIIYEYKNRKNNVNKGCRVIAITLATSYLTYILSEKSDYMILHLDKREQREQWLEIYKVMQKNYNMGLLLGIITFLVASQIIC